MTKKIIIAVSGIVLVVLAALKLAHNKSQINKETTYKDIVENVPVRVITAQQITIADKMDFVGVFKASKEASVSAEVAGRIVSVCANEGSYLNEGQVVAQLDTTILQLQLQTDEAQYAHSQEDLARYENLIKHDATTDVTLKQARLTNKLNEIAVKNTREQIAKCSIKAPVAGYLTTKAFEKGTVVSPGVIIGQVVNVSTLKFTVAVPEYQVVKLVTGQKVHLAADVYPVAEFMGTITQIAEKGDENHIYKVEATVTNNNRQFPLRAAMNGIMKAGGNYKITGIFIPREALSGTTVKPQIYLAVGNKASLKDVTAGRVSGNMIEITDGISLGDKVVVTGLNSIKNDVTIVVAN